MTIILISITILKLPYAELPLKSQFSFDLFNGELRYFIRGRNLISNLGLTCFLHEYRSCHFLVRIVQLGMSDLRNLERCRTPISWTFTSCTTKQRSQMYIHFHVSTLFYIHIYASQTTIHTQ